ncbi:hypothetical protein Ancab_012459 [Ancistrocladus abbreviatus]
MTQSHHFTGIVMGDKKEDEHITIPMPVQESYYQSPLPPENPHTEIVVDKSSQLTPSGGSPSTDEPRPPSGDALPPEAKESEDESFWEWVIIVLILPWFLLYVLCEEFLCSICVREDEEDEVSKSIYQKVLEFKRTEFRVTKLVAAILSLVLTGLLAWLVINLSVKSLKRKIILGSHLWQWTLAVVILSFVYPMINMVTGLILTFLKIKYKRHTDAVYFAEGLKTSINLVIFSAAFSLIWHFYFRSHQGLRKTSDTNLLFRIVRWTLVSFFIFSICWLFKETLLLIWEAHSIYNRFRKRILRAGFQLYFLARISGTSMHNFKPRKMREMVNKAKKENEERTILTNKMALPESTKMGSMKERKKAESEEAKSKDKDSKDLKHEQILDREASMIKMDEERRKKEIKDEKRIDKDITDRRLFEDSATTYQIKRKAKTFIILARLSSRDEEDDISDILEEVHKKFPKDHEYIVEAHLQKFLKVDEEDAKILYAELQGGQPRARVSYKTIEKWMVRAHKSCLALGYTLTDAQHLVNCLNGIMTLGVVVVVIFSWLLFMEIGTTKLLLLVTSPFLAATYVFSDSVKMFLEGVIFAFVRHQFDVGDRCLIDEIEMEVKHISILTTSFLKISGGEVTIYPNSILATKTIVNLTGEPDPNDYIELSLDPTIDESKISELRERIKGVINGSCGAEDDDSSCRIVVKEIENVIKMGVHFKHIMDIADVTHSQCFVAKNDKKSELLLEIKQILREFKSKSS